MMIFYIVLVLLIITTFVTIVLNIDITKQPVNVDIKHSLQMFNFNIKEHGNLLDVTVSFGNNYLIEGFKEDAEKIDITIPYDAKTVKEVDGYLQKAVDDLNNGREGFKDSYLAEVIRTLLIGTFPRTRQFHFDAVAVFRLGIIRRIFVGYLKSKVKLINSARY